MRLPIVGVTAGTVAIGGALFGTVMAPGSRWPPAGMVVGIALLVAALFALGGRRGGIPRPQLLAAGFVFVVLLASLGATLSFGAESAISPLYGGLPRRAAIALYAACLFPLIVLPIIYVFAFDRWTLTEDDLERVRRMSRRGDAPS